MHFHIYVALIAHINNGNVFMGHKLLHRSKKIARMSAMGRKRTFKSNKVYCCFTTARLFKVRIGGNYILVFEDSFYISNR